MRILAVDTTSDLLSLALSDGDRLWRRAVLARGRQEELLPRELDRLLRRAKCKVGDMDLFVAASGPGSFTGVRVGMTFIATLAAALKLPALAISLLEGQAFCASPTALAYGCSRIAAALRAPREEIFFQIFRCARQGIHPLNQPMWVAGAEGPKLFRRWSNSRRVLLTGSATPIVLNWLLKSSAAQIWPGPSMGAQALIEPARQRFLSGALGRWAPLYLKPAYYERSRR